MAGLKHVLSIALAYAAAMLVLCISVVAIVLCAPFLMILEWRDKRRGVDWKPEVMR